MPLADAFDNRVERALLRLAPSLFLQDVFSCPVIGVGVSGGADSVSLLVSLCRIAHQRGFGIKVITVNHNIREECETLGDANSVANLCGNLAQAGYPVACTIKTLPRGDVARAAYERGRGEEEAARYLRYRAFEEFAITNGIKYIALAHNQNDMLETILMRFLTGGYAAGIPEKRETAVCAFIRPMLFASRSEIEEYLAKQGIEYRTDSTNNDIKYFRNKIRHSVIHILDDSLGKAWQKAVLAGAAKARDDEEALSQMASQLKWNKMSVECGLVLSLPIELFLNAPRAIKARVLFAAFNELGIGGRVPYSIISSIASKLCGKYAGVSFEADESFIYAKKTPQIMTDCGFCVIISGEGVYGTPLGMLKARYENGCMTLNLGGGADLSLPADGCYICVRSRAASDEVLTADGTARSVAGIMSSWKADKADRSLIPIVEQHGFVRCVWGSVLGYKDYLVNIWP